MIQIVIISSIIESLVIAASYTQYNIFGVDSIGWDIAIALFTTLKRTLSFLLLILVFHGYKIYRPKLTIAEIVYLSLWNIIYYLVSFGYEFVYYLSYEPYLENLVSLQVVEGIFMVGVLIVNFAYLIIAVIRLFVTFKTLTKAGDKQKRRMYIALCVILVMAYLATILYYFVLTIVLGFNLFDVFWPVWWFGDAYWVVLHIWCLTPVLIIWRPNGNNKRYGYQILENEEGEMEVSKNHNALSPNPIVDSPAPASPTPVKVDDPKSLVDDSKEETIAVPL